MTLISFTEVRVEDARKHNDVVFSAGKDWRKTSEVASLFQVPFSFSRQNHLQGLEWRRGGWVRKQSSKIAAT